MRKKNSINQPNVDNTKNPPTGKKKVKLTKKEITADEVLIQCGIVMVNTISDAKREGATIKFETETMNGEVYEVDIVIKRKSDDKSVMKKV